MAMFVNTNVSSINGQRRLNNATNNLTTTYQRLSSGMRINSAKDDSAGLQISDRMTSQINGLNQGNRNSSDGIALAQTAEGALDESTNMIQRIRTLAVQSANGTNTKSDREAIQKEITALDEEITRIADKTTFNGQQILSGMKGVKAGASMLDAQGNIKFQVGSNANDTLDVNLKEGFSTKDVIENGLKNSDIKITLADIPSTAATAVEVVDLTSGDPLKIASAAPNPGDAHTQSVATSIYRDANDPTKYYVGGDALKEIKDATGKAVKAGSFDGAKLAEILTNSDFGGAAATGAKASTQAFMQDALGIKVTGTKDTLTASFGVTAKVDGLSQQASQGLLKLSDGMINYIDGKRADLGAAQNRMESTIRNQASIAENTSDARARIRDTDFAEETAKLSQQTIIQQAAQSMLMQANQRPQMALSLLG